MTEEKSLPRTSSPMAPAAVLVNQLGYLPGMVKLATVRTGEKSPQAWHLTDSAGKEVLSGQTQVAGTDALAGDMVQLADFSAFTQAGVMVGKDSSHRFDIAPDLYRQGRQSSG